MRYIEHTVRGVWEALVFENEAGSISVSCKCLQHEVCRRIYPASMEDEARAAANHYVLAGTCPCCPNSATDGDFWTRYYAKKGGRK